MKRIFYFVSFCLLAARLQAQDNPPGYSKLAASFAEEYKSFTNHDQIFFERMATLSQSFFSVDNPGFVNQVLSLCEKKKISLDSSLGVTIDSVLHIFSYKYLRNEYDIPFNEKKELLTLYNNAICGCVTPKLEATGGRGIESEEFTKCAIDIMKDTAYVSYLRSKASHFTLQDLQAMEKPASAYIYLYCPAMYKWYTGTIRMSGYSLIDESRRRLIWGDKDIAELHAQKKTAQIQVLFPSYKTYDKHITALLPVTKIKDIQFFPDVLEKQAGSLVVTKTYYTESDKGDITLHAQTLYTFEREHGFSRMQSLSFTPAARLKDKAALVKKIKDWGMDIEPPPPPIELKEAVIIKDTIQGNKQH